ncbi:MAG: tungstate transporter permease [Nitrospirae bacterium GWD2_57_9]|nr:MAG: tungstate transporter permease [Nitrospirae bacterium GWD2_57_9]OGW47721.1 MAG: tungstate transporter permease [Nitrospirae bacterium GWC2_57_9]
MDTITEGFLQAFKLILHLNPDLIGIIVLSLKVSGLALLLATLIGIPLGGFLGLRRFPGHGLAVSSINTFMGLPPVVVGLFVYLLLSRRGPLGALGLLYTPSAMIIAQTILALPIVIALCRSAIVSVDPIIAQAARTLGATPRQVTTTIITEARYGILSAVIAAFGRVMAEVGSILIVGGNIAGYTRVMTTTIALETDKGNFELALALGIILLLISFGVNAALHLVQRKGALHAA